MPWTLDDSRRLGQRIYLLRTKRALSLESLAHLAGITKNHLGLIEQGVASNRDKGSPSNPTMRVIYGIADALEVSPQDLLP